MKNCLTLTLGGLLSVGLAASAAVPTAVPSYGFPSALTVKAPAVNPSTKKQLPEEARNRLKNNKIVSPLSIQNAANRASKNRSEEVRGWFESFEGWDGTPSWLPEGWTMKGQEGLENNAWWHVTDGFFVTAPDGQYFASINYSPVVEQDEWLITPELTVEAGQELSYFVYFNPFYFYQMGNLNWDTMDYEGPKQIAATLQLWVREVGGEWTMLRDFSDEYLEFNGDELLALDAGALWKETQNVEAYVGKTVQFAFRYVGVDGDTVYIDAVRLDAPSIDAYYMCPQPQLWWGFVKAAELMAFPEQRMLYPPYVSTDWLNWTEGTDDASFTWEYQPCEGAETISSGEDDLEATFTMPLDSPEGLANTYVTAPVLKASLPNGAKGSYAVAGELQIGGEATEDGDHVGLIPFSYKNEGFNILTDDKGTPIFGHDSNTTTWWTDHYFRGDPEEGDHAEVTAIANVLMAPASPLVIKGLWLNARGRDIADDAVFTAEIIACEEVEGGYMPMETPLVSASCTGAQILVKEGEEQNMLTLPFDFAEPVVIDNTYGMYFVKISGFFSDKVGYFAPIQSVIPNKERMTLGWIEISITTAYTGGEETNTSLSPIANISGSLGECFNAFAINIDGFYPWIAPRDSSEPVNVSADPVKVPFVGYYDASAYSYSLPDGSALPDGLSASGMGRYGEAFLTLSYAGSDNADIDLLVSAPGVSRILPLHLVGVSALEIVNDKERTQEVMYNLQGIPLNPDKQLPAGLYLNKGHKIVVK